MTGQQAAKPLTPAQLAARWSCSTAHVYTLLTSGELPGFRIGRLWRVSAAAVEAYEAAPGEDPGAPEPAPGDIPAAPSSADVSRLLRRL